MNDAGVVDEQVRAYASQVAENLADLLADTRAELVADLEQHLVEVAAESELPLSASLGPPSEYAEELRTSAGLGRTVSVVSHDSLIESLQRFLERVGNHAGFRAARTQAAELRPAWWVARGLAPVAVTASLSYETSRGLGWFLAGVLGVIVSIAIGRRQMERVDARLGVGLVNVVAAGALVLVLAEFIQFGFPVRYETYVEQVPPRHLVHAGGEPITNIYAFDAEGNPVRGVFLYDGSGKPIEVKRSAGDLFDIQTDYERAADGSLLRNFFPLQQYVRQSSADGTNALRPRPEPRVAIPALADDADATQPIPEATQSSASDTSARTRARGARERPRSR